MSSKNGLGKTVHLYDGITGEYKESYDSYGDVGRKYGLCRTAVYDALRKSKGVIRKIGVVCSLEKFDVYPKMGEIKKIEVKPVIKGDDLAITIKRIVPSVSPSSMLSEDQLRQKHDMFFMIMSYVLKIPAGKYIEEGQLLRELGLYGKPRYRDAIARLELKDYKGKVDGTTYYGNVESIKKLKNEGVLQ